MVLRASSIQYLVSCTAHHIYPLCNILCVVESKLPGYLIASPTPLQILRQLPLMLRVNKISWNRYLTWKRTSCGMVLLTRCRIHPVFDAARMNVSAFNLTFPTSKTIRIKSLMCLSSSCTKKYLNSYCTNSKEAHFPHANKWNRMVAHSSSRREHLAGATLGARQFTPWTRCPLWVSAWLCRYCSRYPYCCQWFSILKQ